MWLIKYISFYDTLICIMENKNHNNIVKKNNVHLLYWGDLLVGVNITSPNIEKNKKTRLFDSYLNSYVKNVLDELRIKKEEPVDKFIVCKVIECVGIEKTNLKKCQVDIANKIIQIVTNAKNIRRDMITVVATSGAFLNDGTFIDNSKIKNLTSEGMFCSPLTLGVDDLFDSEGIIDLEAKYYNNIGKGFFNLI
ncbi:YtpR family tRNA-binding protein [Spiroplasma endosymbiont of Aspidapion aeneum]|uniref:YtpR family tRNA-binding protein n=1 Tax=Spiroplasma endosymbiont of Aspidapion aeneum TaxID=3066276 RepID=UPI00313E218C